MPDRESRSKNPRSAGARAGISADPVTRYALRVAEGKELAGPHVIAACRRHLSDLKRRDLVWDVAAAKDALGFFPEVLRLAGGEHEGQKFKLLPWQAFIVGSIFGWKTRDGFRRFRMAFVETGKGSGKSPIAAGIGLYMLVADGEPRAEIYAAATKKDQAKVLFRDAVAMVEQSPDLYGATRMSGGDEKTNIAYQNSFFRPISSEDRGKGHSGPRPHAGLLDEIHEHPTNAMVEFLRAGTKGRRQALMFMITNSGSNRETVCYDYHDYGVKVCGGAIEDDSFFAYICALDEGDDPFTDEGCWKKANPSLGVTFTKKYLREQVRQARNMPSKQNLVLRLNFCQWTDASSAWIGQEPWDASEVADLDEGEFIGRKCYGGLDLSSKRDLTAKALVFPSEDGTYDAFVTFWTPGATMADRAVTDRVDYLGWRDQGHLIATDRATVDYEDVTRVLALDAERFDLMAVAYDRWRVDLLKEKFEDVGLDIKLIKHGQGFKEMGPAVDLLEEIILNGRLRIQKNPVMRWNIASAVLEEDAAGNRKFTKSKATGRIDGLIALAMAISTAESGDVDAPPSHTATYGVVVI